MASSSTRQPRTPCHAGCMVAHHVGNVVVGTVGATSTPALARGEDTRKGTVATMATLTGFRTWRDRLASGRITHAQAVQFAHAIHALAQGAHPRGKSTNVTHDEACHLVELLATERPVVDELAAARGRRWLADNERKFALPDLPWAEVIEFRFVGAHDYATEWYRQSYYLTSAPVYEARWADGWRFKYAPQAWQAGMGCKDLPRLWWEYTREMVEVDAS